MWVPEDRLRATLLGGIILAPCSVLVSGIATQFTDGKLSIIVNTICFVLNGIGVRACSSTYVSLKQLIRELTDGVIFF